jgi:hypothetical protein
MGIPIFTWFPDILEMIQVLQGESKRYLEMFSTAPSEDWTGKEFYCNICAINESNECIVSL